MRFLEQAAAFQIREQTGNRFVDFGGMLAVDPLTVEQAVEYHPHMQTIQVVLDEKLLGAANRVARRTRVNRSALIRDALRAYLKTIERRELELRDRRGYRAHPDNPSDVAVWERVAEWPPE